MNEWQAENLRILIRYMEASPVAHLDMSNVRHTCGSPACAYGHAEIVPELQARGIPRLLSQARDFFGLIEGHAATSSFRMDWGRLFGACLRVYEEKGDRYKLSFNPTPKEWAAEARRVLTEYGYSIDDGFAAFKAKLLEPLSSEITV